MPLLGHPALVRPFFGYRSERRLILTARALRMREPQWERSGTLGKIAAMIGQFASNEVPELAVTLEVSGEGREPLSVVRTSDGDGFLHFEVELSGGVPLPPEPAWEVARLHWTNRDGPQSVDAYVLAPGREHELAVVSDIDDTILETGAGDLRRNWRRVLAQMPGDREVVPGVAEFYGRLGGGNLGDRMPASRRPFFYVSSSPWNLFDYLVAFQKAHSLPQGPLLLRNWGLNRATLGHGSHGAHKADAIRALTEFYPNLRFALIGDDTQADAIAYADAVRAHPGRIAAVFIRQAPGAGISGEEQQALDAIVAAGVPLWTGTQYEIGADFLATLGFTAGGETTQIVKTIEAAKTISPVS
jgi:phosphatidate phosphatase APP1